MRAKNSSIIKYQIKKCLLFRCRHAVVIMQILNWTNQCPLFMTVRHIFEISEDDPVNSMSFIWNDNMQEKREANARQRHLTCADS